MVPVAMPPVAKVVGVMSAPAETPPTPGIANTVPPQPVPILAVPTQPVTPPKISPVVSALPPVVEAPSPIEFAEASESPVSDEATMQFNFEETVEMQSPFKPATKEQKGKPLKSLFSMFGGKPKANKSVPDATEPTEKVESVAPDIVPEEPASLGFVTDQTAPEEPAKSSDAPLDDDFQNFLRQF
jgi:hypothetical protein